MPTCSNGWNRGVAHCAKVWGPCYLSPLSDRDSLVPLELACKGDIQPVTSDVTLNLITWNILIYCTKYTIYMKYTDILYQIHHIFQSCTRQSVPNILIYCTKYTIYMKYTDILHQIYHIFQSCTRQSVPNILIYCTKYTIYFKAVLDNLYKIYSYTVPNTPYIWNILIYCTKYTIYFKAVLDNLYQIYHIFESCTRQSVWNIPYILYQIYYILYQINHIFQNYTK